jgi:hypothetical protein
MLEQIIKVIPTENHQLYLTYSDHVTVVVDFNKLIEKGGVFAQLKEIFEQVSLSENGRYIYWDNDLEFCADGLRKEGIILDVLKSA